MCHSLSVVYALIHGLCANSPASFQISPEYRYDQKYYRNNSARADFCRSLRQIIRALQNGAVQSKNNFAAFRYCDILLPVSLVTIFLENTFFVQDLCLHIVDGVTRLSSSFKRVAFTTQDLSPKKRKNQILTTKIRNGHDNTFQKWFKEFLHKPPHQKLPFFQSTFGRRSASSTALQADFVNATFVQRAKPLLDRPHERHEKLIATRMV